MVFQQDYKDFLSLLERFEVEYLIIGGYAVALHGYVRATGDIDVWVNTSPENAYKILKVMLLFGYTKEDFSIEDFTHKDSFITFGGYGGYFNILCSIKGIEDFTEALNASKE